MRVFEDGEWVIYKTELGIGNTYCLRHKGCKKANLCSCPGYCSNCNVVAPDSIKGFFELVKWSM